ncbi:MAG: PASTA domain-containing protein [Bacteroidetes bacterium]|nr:PASTA domain-containing protein [Bacteroidota bacterium]
MFDFITKRSLWVNLVAGVVVAILLFGLFLFSLEWLTDQRKIATVPSLAGKSLEEAKSILDSSGFDWKVQDSVYVDSIPPLQIVKQFPDADEVVKANRTILLIIRSVEPPLVEMPNLIGYSFRNAEVVLNTTDLRVKDTLFRPDFARNAVLEQWYNGQQIVPGTKIKKGSGITLVLGDGVGNQPILVPALIGMNFMDAKALLESIGLSFGAIVVESGVQDTTAAWIFKQNPQTLDEDKVAQTIRPGQLIDIWLQELRPRMDSIR